ncbi:hypothetical protein ACTXT7_002353 [Hymenolepis weldensis]
MEENRMWIHLEQLKGSKDPTGTNEEGERREKCCVWWLIEYLEEFDDCADLRMPARSCRLIAILIIVKLGDGINPKTKIGETINDELITATFYSSDT